MFAKLGALALFASAVSALTISLGAEVDLELGEKVALDVTATVTGDPTSVGIVLISPNNLNIQLLDNVAVGAYIEVTIPTNISPEDDYLFAAVEVGSSTVILAETELFAIAAST